MSNARDNRPNPWKELNLWRPSGRAVDRPFMRHYIFCCAFRDWFLTGGGESRFEIIDGRTPSEASVVAVNAGVVPVGDLVDRVRRTTIEVGIGSRWYHEHKREGLQADFLCFIQREEGEYHVYCNDPEYAAIATSALPNAQQAWDDFLADFPEAEEESEGWGWSPRCTWPYRLRVAAKPDEPFDLTFGSSLEGGVFEILNRERPEWCWGFYPIIGEQPSILELKRYNWEQSERGLWFHKGRQSTPGEIKHCNMSIPRNPPPSIPVLDLLITINQCLRKPGVPVHGESWVAVASSKPWPKRNRGTATIGILTTGICGRPWCRKDGAEAHHWLFSAPVPAMCAGLAQAALAEAPGAQWSFLYPTGAYSVCQSALSKLRLAISNRGAWTQDLFNEVVEAGRSRVALDRWLAWVTCLTAKIELKRHESPGNLTITLTPPDPGPKWACGCRLQSSRIFMCCRRHRPRESQEDEA